MLRTFITSFNVSFAESANTFIHFLKRIPLIGKKIPDSLYKGTDIKIFIGVVSQIFGIFGAVFRKALYLGIMLVLPAYLISRKTGLFFAAFLHIFFFLNLIYGAIMNGVVFDFTNNSAYTMVTLMRADARKYYISAMLFKYITNFIYFIIPMIIAGAIVKFSPIKALTMLLLLTSFKFIGEYCNIFMYKKTKKVLGKQNAFIFSFMVVALVLAYALPPFGLYINFEPIFFNPFVIFAVFISWTAALIYLWNYKGYTAISKELLTKENQFDMTNLESDMAFGDVMLREDKLSKEELSSKAYESKQGYNYLNAIFFNRHKKMLVNPVKFRIILIAVIFIASCALVIFLPNENVKSEVYKGILHSAPFLVFLMYLLSTGEKICKAFFYNCDSSLLRYAYYREPKAILTNFTERLKYTLFLNILPALALCISIIGVLIIAGFGGKLISVVPVFLSILSLACFFSIHHLFMYYVIQPYTAQLIVKSPLYKIVNFIVYIICYSSGRIKTSSYIFTAAVIGVTIIYMVIALTVTYKVAPKTFKLK
jgi:hypothetical protein